MSSKTANAKPSRRDNFTQSVIQILYKRSGGRCCKCDAPTFGPMDNNPSKSVNIGQGAHIAAAAPGGPRYDPKMTPEQRSSAANGMWMCSNCHDIIDRDVDAFPTKWLKKMKKEAEKRAQDLIGVGTTARGVRDSRNPLSAGVSASTIVEIRKAKAAILALNGTRIDRAHGEEMMASLSFINPEVDSYLPEVGTEIIAYYEQLVAHCAEPAVGVEVVRRLKIFADAFNKEWTRKDVEQISRVSERVLKKAKSKRSSLYQSGVALLKELSRYSALRSKKLHKIPLKCLKDQRVDLTDGGAQDLTDSAPDPKRMRLDTGDEASGPPPLRAAEATPPVGEEDRYLDLMEQLSMCKNPQKVEEIEDELMSMGYEPNIV